VVTVTVNGALTDFTMHLGRTGEAYFLVRPDRYCSSRHPTHIEPSLLELLGIL